MYICRGGGGGAMPMTPGGGGKLAGGRGIPGGGGGGAIEGLRPSSLKENWRKNCLASLFQWVQNLPSLLSTSREGIWNEELNGTNKKSMKTKKLTLNWSIETYFESDCFIWFGGKQKILPPTIWRFNTLLIGWHESMLRCNSFSNFCNTCKKNMSLVDPLIIIHLQKLTIHLTQTPRHQIIPG